MCLHDNFAFLVQLNIIFRWLDRVRISTLERDRASTDSQFTFWARSKYKLHSRLRLFIIFFCRVALGAQATEIGSEANLFHRRHGSDQTHMKWWHFGFLFNGTTLCCSSLLGRCIKLNLVIEISNVWRSEKGFCGKFYFSTFFLSTTELVELCAVRFDKVSTTGYLYVRLLLFLLFYFFVGWLVG